MQHALGRETPRSQYEVPRHLQFVLPLFSFAPASFLPTIAQGLISSCVQFADREDAQISCHFVLITLLGNPLRVLSRLS